MGRSCFRLDFYQYVFIEYFNVVVYCDFMKHLQSSFYFTFFQSWPFEGIHHVFYTAGVVLSVAYIMCCSSLNFLSCIYFLRGRRGRNRKVVGFTATYAISAHHHCCCEFESRSGRGVQHYAIKFVSDLRQVGGFLRVLHQ